MRRTERVYVISVAAQLAGVHPQTLRFYERRGLIHPQRTPGGSRRYSDGDLELLRRIQELKTEGLTLAGVERLLEMQEHLDRARAEASRLRRELEDLQRHLRHHPASA